MATLETLIKLTDKKLEDCQQVISQIDMRLAVNIQQTEEIQKKIADGHKLAAMDESPAGYGIAHAFHQKGEAHLELLAERKAELEEEKALQLARMRELFAEKKRYEILWERKQAEAKKERQKKEQQNMEDLTQTRQG